MAANMVVRTNVFSLNAHRNMKNVGLEQRRSSNRLASGFRINSAADDAAGLAISENMRAQIRGLDQASRNAQDGQAMILTTEGGLDQIGEMLVRVRELLVQASNDTNTQDQRTMIEQEVNQLAQEIASMQQRVEFNTNRVLAMGPGMAGSVSADMADIQHDMEVLSDAFAVVNENTRQVAVAREILSALPPNSTFADLNTGQQSAVTRALGAVGLDLAAFRTDGVAPVPAAAQSIDAVTPANGHTLTEVISALDTRNLALQATATALNDSINALHLAAENTFGTIRDFAEFRQIDGTAASTVGAQNAQLTWEWNGANVAAVVEWGATLTIDDAAFWTAALPSDVSGVITSGPFKATGDAISGEWTIGFSVASAAQTGLENAFRMGDGRLVAWNAEGAGSWMLVTETSPAQTVTKTPAEITAGPTHSWNLTTPGADLPAVGTVMNVLDGGVYQGHWRLTAVTPASAQVDVPAAPGLASGSTGNNVAFFQVGANANQGITFDFETVSRAVTAAASVATMIGTLVSNPSAGSGIGRGISVTPLINEIQATLDDINSVRANLGAIQNRMDFTMRSLDISSENLSDSESRVRNADIAREMMRFTMQNVLQQAAVSMLSQANQLPQNLLQLLR